jgi:excisionase family DNA binding protein
MQMRRTIVQDEMLLTTGEAATRMGIHPDTLRRWADKGIVPVTRLPNGHRMFRPSDIKHEVKKLNEQRVELLACWNPHSRTNRRNTSLG